MITGSIITLRSKAVKNNVAFLKEHLGLNVRISSVVKANAYGHGIEQIVPLFEEEGIDHFSVFYYDEARQSEKQYSKRIGYCNNGLDSR
jgi:alanine racemase